MKRTLDDDKFFEYFMNVISSGVRTYGQKNEILLKNIDEKWVNAIYGTIQALDTILNKPKKFIEREELIVPIELSRKVGADSVKHLSTHTQFISHVNKDGVVPNKLMNVFNEESFNLYENRFIITLLNVTSFFVDKRYDAILAMGGDEFQSVLKVDSSFDDNDEKVEYNLTMKLYQGQEYLGGGDRNAETFKKIEHIREMLNSFKKTEFYQNMAGCTPVKSPISRTNLMIKNPYFNQCYELWNYLEKYTDAGYSIEQRQTEGVFETEMVDELNSLTLFHYLVMKHNLEDEHNKPPDVTKYKKKRIIKPKFISKMIEEFISDYDIPEPELKQIFEQEISEAYDARRAKEEEIKKALTSALYSEIDKKESKKRENTILGVLERVLKKEKKKK